MPNTYKDDDAKDFLQKARDRFKYCLESWTEIREQHDLDMRFLAGDSWEETEKRRRNDKNLPMIHLDELTQYTNQLINDVRQNKRAVNVLPMGGGANDKTASLRSDWIRGVEYISQAQIAYTTGFEGMVNGSYGFAKLETFYESPKSFNLSARIVPIVNANTILFDPDCKLYDCSDAEDCWEIDFISQDAFRRRYPDAEIKEFTDEVQKVDSFWIKPKQIQLATWWKVEIDKIKLHLVDLKDGNTTVMRSDQMPENFDKKRILKSREYDDRRVVQYIMNGVEVLETNDPKNGKGWPGQWIPIIPFWGKELFIDEGNGSKRCLLSLIRLARDPQRFFNYVASQEMMESKLSPKVPYAGPTGMFSNHAEQWEKVNEEGSAWVEYDTPEGYQPGSVKPERVPFVPNFQSYEMLKESLRRSIMSAMGISPLPTAAQRNNEKSNVALARIQGERSQGSFHFIDNLDRSIVCVGRQLEDLYDRIIDTPRDIPLRGEDGEHRVGRVNDPKNPKNLSLAGDHEVTITTGPSFESQREEAADFADTLAGNPQVFPLIGDLLVKLRNLGPIGDEIAERLTPPQFANQSGEDVPATAKAAMGQMQQQIEAMKQVISQLQMEKAAKVVEKDSAYRIAALQENTKLVVAQASLQRDQAESILQAELTKIQTILGQSHDQAMQAADQSHEHATIAHSAEQDRATAAHAAALAPTEPMNSNGNGTAPQQ
jgi:hypothetical protein